MSRTGRTAEVGPEPLRAELRRRACVAPVIPVVRAELWPHAGAVGAALWAAEARTASS
jgi:hypothetical protein